MNNRKPYMFIVKSLRNHLHVSCIDWGIDEGKLSTTTTLWSSLTKYNTWIFWYTSYVYVFQFILFIINKIFWEFRHGVSKRIYLFSINVCLYKRTLSIYGFQLIHIYVLKDVLYKICI